MNSVSKFLKNTGIIIITQIALVLVISQFSSAASGNGRTAADFLQIGPGARAAGMGGAFSSLADGAQSSYWNPAGLSNNQNSEVMFSHFSWLQDISIEYGSLAFSVSDNSGMAAFITYVNYGQIDNFDAAGNNLGQLSAYDWSGGLSYGMSFGDYLSVGVTAKYINQRLDQFSASAFAADLGIRVQNGPVTVSATAVNFGTSMKFNLIEEQLPSALRLGVAYRLLHNDLTTAIEFEKRIYGNTVIRQGAELGFNNSQYFLRAGLNYFPQASNRSITDGLTFGGGAMFSQFRLDYAFTPQENLTSEDIHRFSLTFLFGQ